MEAYPSVLDIPDPMDLAVIVIPGPQVLEVVKECGEKGVKTVASGEDGVPGPPSKVIPEQVVAQNRP